MRGNNITSDEDFKQSFLNYYITTIVLKSLEKH